MSENREFLTFCSCNWLFGEKNQRVILYPFITKIRIWQLGIRTSTSVSICSGVFHIMQQNSAIRLYTVSLVARQSHKIRKRSSPPLLRMGRSHPYQIAICRLSAFSLVSHRFLFSLESLSCCHQLNNFSSVFSILLSYMALAHVLSHSLATDFIIKLNQDHTTLLCQMRSEVTGWRLQLATTATRNVIEHLLIKYIQCHVKTKGQKQEWIMILVYCEPKPLTVKRAVRDLEKSFRLRNRNQPFFLEQEDYPHQVSMLQQNFSEHVVQVAEIWKCSLITESN